LKACGLKDFTIAICTVSVLRELLDDIVGTGVADEAWRQAILEAFHDNNAVEVARLADVPGIDGRYSEVLGLLPDLRGGGDAIKRCRDLVASLGLEAGLDQLEQTYAIIKGVGAEAYVSVDFSVMSGFDYYTGLVFEAYAPRLGVSLGSGGRYDRMLEAYGSKAPAAGFAFGLERVMAALMEQGALPENDILRPEFARVEVDTTDPAGAFVEAARLRSEGIKAVLSTDPSVGSR
ncbi:MAG TPA: ATP phosphoribosyltransferase regulatory subunit, partial [Coriobacteriia bacterium]|nr:ATP phosphoribosyltransferase regulatory subunit [Coriobacteriia bacterium]